MAGKVYPGSTMFLRMDCGEATATDGTLYEMSTNIGGGTPIIRNRTNGRAWTISWAQLIDLAIEAGVNAPLTKEEKNLWGWAGGERAKKKISGGKRGRTANA